MFFFRVSASVVHSHKHRNIPGWHPFAHGIRVHQERAYKFRHQVLCGLKDDVWSNVHPNAIVTYLSENLPQEIADGAWGPDVRQVFKISVKLGRCTKSLPLKLKLQSDFLLGSQRRLPFSGR